MKRFYSAMLLLVMLTIPTTSKTELLILKQTDAGFAVLDDSDKQNISIIEKILLRYQWPTSAAFALDPITERRNILAETGDLFTPEKPNAEEIWIEQKIQEETGNQAYRVIFFPTALYEIFLIYFMLSEPADPEQPTPFSHIKTEMSETRANRVGLSLIIENNGKAEDIRNEIKKVYENMNKKAIHASYNLHNEINAEITSFLLSKYLKSSTTSLECSTIIKNNAFEMLSSLLPFFVNDRYYSHQYRHFFNGIRNERSSQIIARYIELEYEARNLNKGILVRGTSFIKFKPLLDNQSEELIAGSTIFENKEKFEKTYYQNELKPYSISFGNSLFAGFFNDPDACAYLYLIKDLGYALLIDKRNYIENRASDLFFIAPLCTAISIFTTGEHFHSRTKAATSLKNDSRMRVLGVNDGSLLDKTGVIFITRDPLEHASLFSKYLTNNGRMIQYGDTSSFTQEEKAFAEKVKQAQKNATNYYKGIKGAKSFTEKMVPQTRERIKKKETMQEKNPATIAQQPSSVE